MAGQNVPLMLTQGITVTNDSLVHFMPDTTPRAAKKVYLVFLSLSAVWTLGVWGAAGELIHDLRSKYYPLLRNASKTDSYFFSLLVTCKYFSFPQGVKRDFNISISGCV